MKQKAIEFLCPLMVGFLVGAVSCLETKSTKIKNKDFEIDRLNKKLRGNQMYIEGYEDGCRHMDGYWMNKLKRMGFYK